MAPATQSPLSDLAASAGMPVYLGSYNVTTTSKTNGQVGTTFNTSGDGLAGKTLLLITDADVRILPVTSSTGVVTTTRDAAGFGVLVSAGSRVTLRMGPAATHLAIIHASSTANVDVWELV